MHNVRHGLSEFYLLGTRHAIPIPGSAPELFGRHWCCTRAQRPASLAACNHCLRCPRGPSSTSTSVCIGPSLNTDERLICGNLLAAACRPGMIYVYTARSPSCSHSIRPSESSGLPDFQRDYPCSWVNVTGLGMVFRVDDLAIAF